MRSPEPLPHPLTSSRLAEAGIRHRYEEFDDDHSDIDYRMAVSLPFLYHPFCRPASTNE